MEANLYIPHDDDACAVYIMTRCWGRKYRPVGCAHAVFFHCISEAIVGYEPARFPFFQGLQSECEKLFHFF